MNYIAPRAEPLIREIPLSRLALAPENVRKTPSDPRADAELKASIAALGLLENLVVRNDEDDRYAVVAGGRRLKAMQALVEDAVFDPEHPVACQVRAKDADPGEISLAENVVRIAMHPADQVVAFTKLVQAGQSVSSVAARFGLTERLVEQRLRLGNAAPELLDAYRADEIDLEVLKAFAVTTDRERQMAVWEQVSAQGYRPSAWQVKRLLTEERVPGATAIARFVGVEAYEAAGGVVLRDLFARDDETGVWFEGPVLLAKLATGKLQAAADELATRWKWAVAMIEVEWGDTARYGRIEPQPAERTAEEQAEIAKLEARQAELAETADDDWTEEVLAEAESIETRLDEIEGAIEARAVWRREDFAMAGCIVTIAQDGSLQVIAGLVKPEDMPNRRESAESGSDVRSALARIVAPVPGVPTGKCTRSAITPYRKRAIAWRRSSSDSFMSRSSSVGLSGPGTMTLRTGRRRIRPHRVLESRIATAHPDPVGLEAQRSRHRPQLRRHQAAQLHQRAVALETLAHRHHGGGAARQPVGDQADDAGKNVVDQAKPAAHPMYRAGKLDRVPAQIVRRRLQAPSALGRGGNRLQLVQRARQPRRQTVRQKADGRMALRAIPASNLRAARGLPRVGAVACQRTSAVRVIRAAIKPCIAPRLGPNVFLAGKPRLITKLHTGHGPAGISPRGPLSCSSSARAYGRTPATQNRHVGSSRIRPPSREIHRSLNAGKKPVLLSS